MISSLEKYIVTELLPEKDLKHFLPKNKNNISINHIFQMYIIITFLFIITYFYRIKDIAAGME